MGHIQQVALPLRGHLVHVAQLSHCILTKLGIRSRQPDVRLTCKGTAELIAGSARSLRCDV